jgi:hypothetical protein
MQQSVVRPFTFETGDVFELAYVFYFHSPACTTSQMLLQFSTSSAQTLILTTSQCEPTPMFNLAECLQACDCSPEYQSYNALASIKVSCSERELTVDVALALVRLRHK